VKKTGCTKILLTHIGGAGGKGVWGKPGSELDVPEVMDEKDPNYDSDSLDNGDVTLQAIVPQLSLEEINKHLEPVILEYYSHGDTREVLFIFFYIIDTIDFLFISSVRRNRIH